MCSKTILLEESYFEVVFINIKRMPRKFKNYTHKQF